MDLALNTGNLEKGVQGVLHVAFLIQSFFVQTRESGAGVVICIVMILTFIHSNLLLQREVIRNRVTSFWSLSTVIWNIITCVLFTAYVLDDKNLFVSCIFIPPSSVHSFMYLLWILGINDFMIKYFVICIKIFLTILPNLVLPHMNRGKYYQFLELTSQIYREVATIPPWVQYLIPFLWRSLAHCLVYSLFLILYSLLKCFTLKMRVSIWLESVQWCMGANMCGKVPPKDRLLLSGGTCSICQDSFQKPIELDCQHIFCSACVWQWLDKEKTCPMCRALVQQNITWRDGTTSPFIQFT